MNGKLNEKDITVITVQVNFTAFPVCGRKEGSPSLKWMVRAYFPYFLYSRIRECIILRSLLKKRVTDDVPR